MLFNLILLTIILVALPIGLIHYRQHLYAFISIPTVLMIIVFELIGYNLLSLLINLPFLAILLIGTIPQWRFSLITKPIMKKLHQALPNISETEQIALASGATWWDSDLLQGIDSLDKLLKFRIKTLSKEEKQFIEEKIPALCKIASDSEIVAQQNLPKAMWDYLKANGFFALIIPKIYGGLEFSAQAHSEIITRLATHSPSLAVTVMVPNSLGPAELLLHYGTDDQKQHYLPKLADGSEIPCFGLTELHAGSDAASIQSNGMVCRQKFNGKLTLGIKLNWNKRYITLAPIATVVGLAFHLEDPEQLLKKGKNAIGITCALIPRDMPGITMGQRHNPMGVPFLNGPTKGKDIFIPLNYVIGGEEGLGEGWKMLMESLNVGRAISLPAMSVGASKLSLWTSLRYSFVRRQFSTSIGQFEGVSEKIAQLLLNNYKTESLRYLTAACIDNGIKPAVLSAITKVATTEIMRHDIQQSMDILGGHAICQGKHNIISQAFLAMPIGITVEGSNILTRSLIIFGQGILRAHPFLFPEMQALQAQDEKRFHQLFWQHAAYSSTNIARTFLGSFAFNQAKGLEYWEKQLTQASYRLAVLADVSAALLGGKLKIKESFSGKMADALSASYTISAMLKHFYDLSPSQQSHYEPLFNTALTQSFQSFYDSLMDALENLPTFGIVRLKLKWLLFPLGKPCFKLKDKAILSLAQAAIFEDAFSELLEPIIKESPSTQALSEAFKASQTIANFQEKMDKANFKKLMKTPKNQLEETLQSMVKSKILTKAEQSTFLKAEATINEALQVEVFETL